MLQLPGTPFGFAAPLALIGIPLAVGFLMYVYRRGGKQERVRVGTLFLLQHLAGRPLARRAFLPPPRFFLDLLLLTLAVIALSGLLREAPRETIALLIDNSLSMSATVEGSSGTRLSSALERANAVLRNAPSHSRVQVFTTTPEMAPLLSEPGTLDAARDALRRITAGYSADELPSRLSSLMANPEWTKLVVVTDHHISEMRRDDGPSRLVSEEISPAARGVTNLAIRVVSVERNGAKRSVRLEITSFGEKLDEVNLTISRHILDGSAYPLVERNVKLDSDGKSTLTLDNLPDAPAFSARVSVPAVRDILPDDNVTWWTLSAAGSRIAYLGDMALEKSGLPRIPGVEIEALSPDARELPPGVSTVIFHRRMPFKTPGVSQLTILPPEGDGNTALEGVARARLSRWIEHPILRYLHLELLQPTAMVILPGPAWSEPVVWSEEGPVVRVGHAGDARHVWAGLEILPYEGRKSPTLSLFLLNALQWLGQTTFGIGATPAGLRVALPAGTERLIDPTGRTLTVEPGTSQTTLPQPGLYRVEVAGAAPQLLAAAISGFEEANVFEVAPIVVQQPSFKSRAASTSLEPLTQLVLILVSVLLILEMGVGVFRLRRVRRE